MNTDLFKTRLAEEKQKLEHEMTSIARPNPAMPGDWEQLPSEAVSEPDPLDRAEITTSREDDAAVLADLEARYASVNAALARVESGTYGVCATCGKPIEAERLTADPAATTCIEHL